MRPSVLMNCKWKTASQITGVQRYSIEVHEAMLRAGYKFDCAEPKNSNRIMSVGFEQIRLASLSKKYESLYCPANMAPLVLSGQTRLIFTLHCLRFHFHPENYSSAFGKWYRFAIPRLLARADSVLTVSRTAASEIEQVFPQAIGKIHVAYPGVSKVFTGDGSQGDRRIPNQSYFVFIGNVAPAKNLKLLLQAFQSNQSDALLVLIGVSQTQLDSMGVAYRNDKVIPLGHINSDKTIASILRGATGLLAPSLYESFDLPTVEAMGCACPVVASDTEVHHEICKSAAIYLPSDNPESWSTVIDEMTIDITNYNDQISNGIERAKLFCWDKTAFEIIQIIESGRV